MATAFLSHSSVDKATARRVARRLEHRGVQVWLDESELRLGDELSPRLRREIEQVEFVLVLASPAASTSTWVQLEVDAAVSSTKTIVPLFLSRATSYGRLDNYKGVLLEPLRFEHTLDELARAMLGVADVGERDPSVFDRHLVALSDECPLAVAVMASNDLVGALNAAVIDVAEHPCVETLLWINYERPLAPDDRAKVASGAAVLFRRWGLGFEVLQDFARSCEDQHLMWWMLGALTHEPMARADLISPAMQLFVSLRTPSDVHFSWFVRKNFDAMSGEDRETAIFFTAADSSWSDPSFDRVSLGDFLFRQFPADVRLQSAWAHWIATNDTTVQRKCILALNNAIEEGLSQYEPAMRNLEYHVRGMARSDQIGQRCQAVLSLVNFRDCGYRRFSNLYEEVDGAVGSAEWKSIQLPDRFTGVYLRAVDAVRTADPDEWQHIEALLDIAADAR